MFQMAGWSRDSRENCEGTGAGQLVVGLRTIFTISALFQTQWDSRLKDLQYGSDKLNNKENEL